MAKQWEAQISRLAFSEKVKFCLAIVICSTTVMVTTQLGAQTEFKGAEYILGRFYSQRFLFSLFAYAPETCFIDRRWPEKGNAAGSRYFYSRNCLVVYPAANPLSGILHVQTTHIPGHRIPTCLAKSDLTLLDKTIFMASKSHPRF